MAYLGLPSYYNTGTASVDVGGTVVTFQLAFLGTLDFPAVLPGDLFMDPAQPEFPPQRIASIDYAADPQTATLATVWPGAAMTANPYEIRLVGNIERSTAQTRRYLELLGQIGYTGIAVNAFGEFSDRSLYDDTVQGFTFLSLDGDGTLDSPPYIYIKKSSASADWSDPISFIGNEGPPGPTGDAAAWLSGTGVPSGGLGNNGDMYIDVATADVYGPKTAGSWGAIAINIKGATGSPGIDGTSMLTRVRVVSEVNIDIANLNNGDTVDGVVVGTNWLVLLAGQTDATENGVYVIGATAGTTVRVAAFDTYDEHPGVYFSVMQGTANADTLWKCSSDLGGTIGVDDLIFEMFASSEGFMSRVYASYALNSGVSYTLPSTPASDNALDVYVGGILQPKGGVAYAFTGTSLTLSEDPGATDLVEAYIFEALAMGAVPPSSVGSAEINAAQAAAIRVVLGILGTPREVLAANRTYYVRTDGSDSNNGLTNTSGGAFLTLQKAFDTIATIDGNGFSLTIQAGTMTGNLSCDKNLVGVASLTLDIAGGTLTGKIHVSKPMSLTVKNGTFLNTADHVLTADGPGSEIIVSTSVTFGVSTGRRHLNAVQNGKIVLASGYTISGGAAWHYFAQLGGIIENKAVAVTLTGTPAFSSEFAYADMGGIISVFPGSFSGSATGKRFNANTGGIINAWGSGLTYLPGNAAGTVANGGIYDTLIGGVREVLTANRTYYVRTDGSDSNNGLANTSGGAFLTIQKAVNVAATLDANGFSITIQAADGTYTGAVTLKSVVGVAGAGQLIIRGNNTTPANVVISTTSADCFAADGVISPWDILDLKMQTTTAGNCITSQGGSLIRYGNVNFGACAGTHVNAIQRGSAIAISNYAISGGASVHLSATYASFININGMTLTITGTPAFGFAFATAQLSSTLAAAGNTFSGAATGTRHYVSQGSTIFTNGTTINTYFPGNANGTGTNLSVTPWGLYA